MRNKVEQGARVPAPRPGAADVLLPEVLAERCVHALMEQASCSACADACPVGAWVIDDERLGIDEDLCDGCGLCAPACPQGAVLQRYAPASFRIDGTLVAFAACVKAGVDNANQGLLPCLHILGLHRLLQLHNQGIRRLVLSRGDCNDCSRGRVTRIDENLQQADVLLRSRGEAPIKADMLGAQIWNRALSAANARHRAPTLSRRDLFRRTARALSEGSTELIERLETGAPTFTPPGRLLPNTGQTPLWLNAPSIDPLVCSGCDACARLCPQGSISIEPDAYRLEADSCTDCGICSDVCMTDAIEIDHLQAEPQSLLPLRANQCRACGAPYHIPAGRPPGEDLCSVCTTANHHTNLFQVHG